jgi:hypothetical protein
MQNDIKASKTAVFKAANTLLAQGIQPSVQKVRRFLGGGNVAGISRYLKEWRKTLENTQNEAKTMQNACPKHLEIHEPGKTRTKAQPACRRYENPEMDADDHMACTGHGNRHGCIF